MYVQCLYNNSTAQQQLIQKSEVYKSLTEEVCL